MISGDMSVTAASVILITGMSAGIGSRLLYDFIVAGKKYMTKEECKSRQSHCMAPLTLAQHDSLLQEIKSNSKDIYTSIEEIKINIAVLAEKQKNR